MGTGVAGVAAPMASDAMEPPPETMMPINAEAMPALVPKPINASPEAVGLTAPTSEQ